MRTISALSNITWNTPGYLKQKLETMVKEGTLDFWAFVRHMPEIDEIDPLDDSPCKEHIHLFIQPASVLNTKDFSVKFAEYVPGEDLPRKPTSDWRRSKFADWYLYASHDVNYLAKKGLVRQYHYKPDDFFRSDDLAWRARLDDVPNVFGISQVIISAARNCTPWHELISQGLIPLANYRQARELYNDVVAMPFAGDPIEDPEKK